MREAKRTFFLSNEETELLRKINNSPSIAMNVPHYQVESGEILYAHKNSNGELWYTPLKDNS